METNNNINRELLSKTFTTLETMYPGVLEPYRQKSEKIAAMLRERFDEDFCHKACILLHSAYKILPGRNRELLLEKVNIVFARQLSEEEASRILNIIVFNQEVIDEEADFLAAQMKANMGMGDAENSGDEVETAAGRFGYDVTNPIPLNGTDMIKNYFRNLRFITGESVVYQRQGSVAAENLPFPVDKYVVGTNEQPEQAVLYVYAYHSAMSAKAPEGFRLIS